MATILELEVHIDPTRDTINGQAYFAGAHRAIGDIFNDEEGRVRASVEVTGGLTGTETALRFYYHPASAGLERLDKVI